MFLHDSDELICRMVLPCTNTQLYPEFFYEKMPPTYNFILLYILQYKQNEIQLVLDLQLPYFITIILEAV